MKLLHGRKLVCEDDLERRATDDLGLAARALVHPRLSPRSVPGPSVRSLMSGIHRVVGGQHVPLYRSLAG